MIIGPGPRGVLAVGALVDVDRRVDLAEVEAPVLDGEVGPLGGVPTAVPVLLYWQAAAVPLAVQVMDSPGWRAVLGQLTGLTLSSVTVTLVRGTSPVLVTM